MGNDEFRLPGNATVLVVDDEDLMRTVGSMMIEELGGTALTAVDGLDAVEVFADHHDEIEFVLMDFSMPRMNGYEALHEIWKIKPTVSAVMVSGLEITPDVNRLLQEGKIEFIKKPYRQDDVATSFARLKERAAA